MGYLRNHLATVSTAAFAAVLTGLWPWFAGWTDLLGLIFTMAVPIAWFMALTCWLAQKSADYVKARAPEKKSSEPAESGLEQEKAELSSEIDSLKATVRVKDGQIERLEGMVSALETRVQIEALRAEIADLKAAARA